MIDKNDPRLTAYVLDELSAEDKLLIEAAIAESPELQSVVNELSSTASILQDGYQLQGNDVLSQSQKAALRDEVLGDGKTRLADANRSKSAGSRRLPWAVLAASLLALCVGGAWWFTGNDYLQVGQRRSASEIATFRRLRKPGSFGSGSEPIALGLDNESWEESKGMVDAKSQLSVASRSEQTTQQLSRDTTASLSLEIRQQQELIENEESFARGGGGIGGAAADGFRYSAEGRPNEPSDESLTDFYSFGGRTLDATAEDRLDVKLNTATNSYGADMDMGMDMDMGRSAGGGREERLGARERFRRKVNANTIDGESTSDWEFERLEQVVDEVASVDAWLDTQKPLSPAATSEPEQESEDELHLMKRRAAKLGDKTEELKTRIQHEKAPAKKPSWKRVKATPNTTRLMVGDHDELELNGMQVNVQVDGFRARVLIDCLYYNDRDQQLEGNFKLRLPDDASPWYFAFGESVYDFSPTAPADRLIKNEFDARTMQLASFQPREIRRQRQDDWTNVKEARMVPRVRAAFAYEQTIRRKVDPALVEWSGAGVFDARVFPLSPHKMHRIVFGYDVNLTRTDEGYTYELALPEKTGHCVVDVKVNRIEESKITSQAAPSPDADPEVQKSSFEQYRWTNPKTKVVRVNVPSTSNLLLQYSDEQEGDFWGIQLTPKLANESVAGNERAILLLDTSLSSNPDKFNVWLQLLKATLDNNRDSLKEFNVLFFDVGSAFWRDSYVENTQSNVDALIKDCEELSLEGATDLYGAIERIAAAQWIASKENGPDLFLLSDGAANWGETDIRLTQSLIDDKNLGNLFAYQTGLTGTAIANLRFLTNSSGGAVFSVATEDEIAAASTAHRKRPWRLDSIDADGATDMMTAGRIEWVYPGQTVTIVGRGKPSGDLKLNLSQGDKTKTVSVSATRIESELAGRFYGQVAVAQLESLGNKVFDVAAAYARHFRVTGQTCSLLMLETEADYERFGIKPEEDLFVVKTKNAGEIVSDTLAEFAEALADPKERLLGWLKRLETMPGMNFKIPTALSLALEQVKVVAISKPLQTDPRDKLDAPESYLQQLASDDPDYEAVSTESQRRSAKSIDEGLKVLSNLIERHPGDLVIARDVAFSAMQLDRPAQAYPLLMKVAKARPFEGSVYPAIAQCLAQLEQADMAIIFYEVALTAKFNNQGADYRKILAADYLHLLTQVESGELKSSVSDFVKARRKTLVETLGFDKADMLITMMWNTDQTDVDLHIGEPGGSECSYQNKTTPIGGHITADITTGFGPEMYHLPEAPNGKYDVRVKLFANNQSRASLRNRVHLKIYRNFGDQKVQVSHKSVQLKTVGELEHVAAVGVEK